MFIFLDASVFYFDIFCVILSVSVIFRNDSAYRKSLSFTKQTVHILRAFVTLISVEVILLIDSSKH